MTALCQQCSFATSRLLVKEWHSVILDENVLAEVVASVLTDRVTRTLPGGWQGSYTVVRAKTWIEERDHQGTTLLAVEKWTDRPIGLMILYETKEDSGVPGQVDGVEIRIGYLLSESAWGRGLATEMMKGFVAWCREHATIRSLAGGVERQHPASARVLEKSGFLVVRGDDEPQNERLFRLNLRA